MRLRMNITCSNNAIIKLYFHQLTDRVPTLLSGTVKSGYHAASIDNQSIKLFQINKELYDVGIVDMKSIYGNKIKVYNLERTICDIVRSRNQIEAQDFQSALRFYVIRKDKDIPLLMRYAKMFRVDKILIEYLKVLL